ncbi:MAG: sulfite exporter TauE/SafE family protein [Elainellaceae cyanobacterium]
MDIDITAIAVAWVVTIVLLAATIQSIVGFGSALISAPLLISLLSSDVAIPLLSLIGVTQQSLLWVLYRQAFNWRATVRLAIASLALIPAGVLLVDYFPERVVLAILGIIIIAYAACELSRVRLPDLTSPRWAYLFGGAAGVLSGAYNISGPPVILYANCRRWQPDEFKSNLQGFFLINSVLLVLSRALQHQLTVNVGLLCLMALPAIAVGSFAGARLSRQLDPDRFRKIVLVLLIFLGLSLLR